jgi:hypothetical protein
MLYRAATAPADRRAYQRDVELVLADAAAVAERAPATVLQRPERGRAITR